MKRFLRPWCWLFSHKYGIWSPDMLVFVIIPLPIMRRTCKRCGHREVDIGF